MTTSCGSTDPLVSSSSAASGPIVILPGVSSNTAIATDGATTVYLSTAGSSTELGQIIKLPVGERIAALPPPLISSVDRNLASPFAHAGTRLYWQTDQGDLFGCDDNGRNCGIVASMPTTHKVGEGAFFQVSSAGIFVGADPKAYSRHHLLELRPGTSELQVLLGDYANQLTDAFKTRCRSEGHPGSAYDFRIAATTTGVFVIERCVGGSPSRIIYRPTGSQTFSQYYMSDTVPEIKSLFAYGEDLFFLGMSEEQDRKAERLYRISAGQSQPAQPLFTVNGAFDDRLTFGERFICAHDRTADFYCFDSMAPERGIQLVFRPAQGQFTGSPLLVGNHLYWIQYALGSPLGILAAIDLSAPGLPCGAQPAAIAQP